MRIGRQGLAGGNPVERDRRWPRPPARWPARVRGRQGCSLAAMGAVGIQLGSVDEGSPRAHPGAARSFCADGKAAWAARQALGHHSTAFKPIYS